MGREAELEAITHQKNKEEQDTTVITAESSGCGQSCSGCGQLKCELDAALLKLNEQSCAKYGDLLRENFTLTQKVSRKHYSPLSNKVQYRMDISVCYIAMFL